MNATSSLTGAFRSAVEQPAQGVVGLVDNLLELCQQYGLQLEWQADSCLRIRSLEDDSEAVVGEPLRQSVFRALLARLAALCNEQTPHSVSPYGGQGRFSLATRPGTIFGVSFANTPDEQWFRLRPIPADELQPRLEELQQTNAELAKKIEILEFQNAELAARLLNDQQTEEWAMYRDNYYDSFVDG